MDSFDTCTVVRYWSKFVQSAIRFQLSDLEVKVKVMDLENRCFVDSDGILCHYAWHRFNLFLI